jgi:hypothetical protein
VVPEEPAADQFGNVANEYANLGRHLAYDSASLEHLHTHTVLAPLLPLRRTVPDQEMLPLDRDQHALRRSTKPALIQEPEEGIYDSVSERINQLPNSAIERNQRRSPVMRKKQFESQDFYDRKFS